MVPSPALNRTAQYTAPTRLRVGRGPPVGLSLTSTRIVLEASVRPRSPDRRCMEES
jgi:hypothetical protein